MKVYTEVGHYKATPEVIFELLSKPENLPKWAITFCKKIEKKEECYYVTSPNGDEVLFYIDADKSNGIIDMFVGLTKENMWRFPARVTDDNMDGSVFTFTLIQSPNLTDEDFEAQRQGILVELDEIRKLVE